MGRSWLFRAVIVGLAALLAVAGSPAAAGSSTAAASPTDPATLVNDPTADTTARHTQNSPALAVLGDTVVAAYTDTSSHGASPNQRTGWSRSTDGGRTFTDMGGLPPSPKGDNGTPALAADTATGTVYLATPNFWSTSIWVFRSTPGGEAFHPPTNATPGVGIGAHTAPTIAVDDAPGPCQGTVYLGWKQGRWRPAFTRSTDGGVTFGPPGGAVLGEESSMDPTVVVGADHRVHYAWLAGDRVLVRTSTDCGARFGRAVTAARADGPLLGLAAASAAGRLVLAYAATDGDEPEIRVVTSTDGAATWSPPVALPVVARGLDRLLPAIALSADGTRLLVTWYDGRHDALGLLVQRYGRMAVVSGGTMTFGAEMLLGSAFPTGDADSASYDPQLGMQAAAVAVGDAFVAVWGDRRDGDAFANHQADVRFARTPMRGSADVSVSFATGLPVAQGQHDTLDVVVANRRSGVAEGVFLQVDLAGGLVAVGASPGYHAGGCTFGRTVTCRFGTMTPGQRIHLGLSLLGVRPGTVPVLATVTTATRDPDLSTNTDSGTIRVDPGTTRTALATTGDIARAIPDRSLIDVPFTVDDPGHVVDLAVGVRLDHDYLSDVVLTLISPEGTAVVLADQAGAPYVTYGDGPGDCAGTPATFADDADVPIADAAPPLTGRYRPAEPLATLTGEPAAGVWRLRVADVARHYVGTVFCVEAAVEVTP